MARSKEGGGKPPREQGPAGKAGDRSGRVSVRLEPDEISRIDALARLLPDEEPRSRAAMLRQLVRRGLELLEQHPEKARALLAGLAPPPDPPPRKGRKKLLKGS